MRANCKEIGENFKGIYDGTIISRILNSLGTAGLIDYESPYREIDGKKTKGWAVYKKIKNITEEDIERILNNYNINNKIFHRVCDCLNNLNENEEMEHNKIAKKLNYKHTSLISSCISILEKEGFLESTFNYKQKSLAKPNEITKLFDKIILQPAEYIAKELCPVKSDYEINRDKIEHFLENYNEENRKRRDFLNSIKPILEKHGEMKLSHIAQEFNKTYGCSLSLTTVWSHLKKGIKKGFIEKTEKGYYKLKTAVSSSV